MSQHWIPVRNMESVAVPPFALMRVTGVDDEGRMTVTKPDRDGQTDLLINGPSTIPANGAGVGHMTFPAIVAYSADLDPHTDPAAGEVWGVRAGDWFLHMDRPGFRIEGGAGDNLVNVSRMDQVALSFVRVTSLTKVDGRYPAKIQTYDPVTKAWADGADVWYVDSND